MIEDYISTARRTKPASVALVGEYHKYYDRIKAHVNPLGGYPDLFVTFSSERRCELVQLGGKQYLVYDQYLGQSFNRLNRIQFARHDPDMLSMAYACKFVAERLVTMNAIGPAVFFGLMSREFEKNAHTSGDPFKNPGEDETLRHQLIAAQEMFVMAHELAHHRWALDQAALSSEMSEYIDQFLRSKDELEPTAASSQPLSSYYRTILSSAAPDFMEELFADDFGGLIAMRAALTLGVRPWQASLGVILAFKYLRLFRHLEILARRIATLAQSGEAVDFQSMLKSLKHEIWDSETGGIGRFQFREHFLRYRLGADRKTLPDYDSSNESKIITVVGDYDQKTEFPAILDLVDRLASPLTPNLFLELERSIHASGSGSDVVDHLTGWQPIQSVPISRPV